MGWERRMGLFGRRVNEKLGAGAFGTVYKMDSPSSASFHSKHPIVAVKKIRVSTFEIFILLCDLISLSGSCGQCGRRNQFNEKLKA